MDIIKLVKKSKKGNKLAFSTLIKNYEKDLYRVAIAITKNENEALDCIQENITLTDENNKTVKGKLVTGTDNIAEEVSVSDIIELPIPKANEEVSINKEVELEIKDKFFEGSNTKVKIVSVQRTNKDTYKMKLEFRDSHKESKVHLEECVVVPTGASISPEAKDWFEGGLSGGWYGESGIEWNFKLPYPEADKLYIKIKGSNYKIEGPWEILID